MTNPITKAREALRAERYTHIPSAGGDTAALTDAALDAIEADNAALMRERDALYAHVWTACEYLRAEGLTQVPAMLERKAQSIVGKPAAQQDTPCERDA